jgi:hypothetical protein
MNETRSYQVWPRDKSIMPGIRELISFLEKRKRRLCLNPGTGQLYFTTPEGKSLSSKSIEEVAPYLDNIPFPQRWVLMGVAPKEGESDYAMSLRIFIDHDYKGALITVDSEDLDLLEATFRQIERSFGYEQLPRSIERIRWAPHATALIGCHFDEAGKHAGQRLQKFLSLIGFRRVDIADTVRAAPIQEKVRELLDKNSFYIAIVTGNRDHAWISAESGYAIAKNKEVVLIVQSGVKFNPTLYGRDREHITFTSSIDEAFIGLLEDFRSRSVLGLM